MAHESPDAPEGLPTEFPAYAAPTGMGLKDLPAMVRRRAYAMAARERSSTPVDPLFRRMAVRATSWLDRRSPTATATLDAFYREGRPLLLGHRGAMARAPENTLGAFQAAVDDGGDGIELDVTLSGDSVPVVIHDDTLDRTTNVLGKPSDYDVEELAGIDAGSWFPGWGFEPVPRLEQVFAAMPAGSVVNVELKGPSPAWATLERIVVDVIRGHRHRLHIVVSSFHPAQLLEVRRLDREVPIGLLISARSIMPLRTGWALPALGADALHAPAKLVDAALMKAARDAKMRVHVWAIRSVDEAARLIDLGVDGLIVDDVASVRALVK